MISSNQHLRWTISCTIHVQLEVPVKQGLTYIGAKPLSYISQKKRILQNKGKIINGNIVRKFINMYAPTFILILLPF